MAVKRKNMPLLQDEDIILESWLYKSPPRQRVKNKKSWKRRYFRLLNVRKETYIKLIKSCQKKYLHDGVNIEEQPSIFCLVYWKNESLQEFPIRVISLKDCSIQDQQQQQLFWQIKFQHILLLTTNTRKYFICAECEITKKHWFDAFRQSIILLKEPIYDEVRIYETADEVLQLTAKGYNDRSKHHARRFRSPSESDCLFWTLKEEQRIKRDSGCYNSTGASSRTSSTVSNISGKCPPYMNIAWSQNINNVIRETTAHTDNVFYASLLPETDDYNDQEYASCILNSKAKIDPYYKEVEEYNDCLYSNVCNSEISTDQHSNFSINDFINDIPASSDKLALNNIIENEYSLSDNVEASHSSDGEINYSNSVGNIDEYFSLMSVDDIIFKKYGNESLLYRNDGDSLWSDSCRSSIILREKELKALKDKLIRSKFPIIKSPPLASSSPSIGICRQVESQFPINEPLGSLSPRDETEPLLLRDRTLEFLLPRDETSRFQQDDVLEASLSKESFQQDLLESPLSRHNKPLKSPHQQDNIDEFPFPPQTRIKESNASSHFNNLKSLNETNEICLGNIKIKCPSNNRIEISGKTILISALSTSNNNFFEMKSISETIRQITCHEIEIQYPATSNVNMNVSRLTIISNSEGYSVEINNPKQ